MPDSSLYLVIASDIMSTGLKLYISRLLLKHKCTLNGFLGDVALTSFDLSPPG